MGTKRPIAGTVLTSDARWDESKTWDEDARSKKRNLKPKRCSLQFGSTRLALILATSSSEKPRVPFT